MALGSVSLFISFRPLPSEDNKRLESLWWNSSFKHCLLSNSICGKSVLLRQPHSQTAPLHHTASHFSMSPSANGEGELQDFFKVKERVITRMKCSIFMFVDKDNSLFTRTTMSSGG